MIILAQRRGCRALVSPLGRLLRQPYGDDHGRCRLRAGGTYRTGCSASYGVAPWQRRSSTLSAPVAAGSDATTTTPLGSATWKTTARTGIFGSRSSRAT